MVNILDLFTPEQLNQFEKRISRTGEDCYNGPCPSCGRCSSGSNSSGMTIFPASNTAYCHGSKTIFNILELVALIKGIISCSEGRQKI